MMKFLILKSKEGDWLPIFPCWNSYTSAMRGDHAIAAIADTNCKNVIDLSQKEYALLLKNATESPKNYSGYQHHCKFSVVKNNGTAPYKILFYLPYYFLLPLLERAYHSTFYTIDF